MLCISISYTAIIIWLINHKYYKMSLNKFKTLAKLQSHINMSISTVKTKKYILDEKLVAGFIRIYSFSLIIPSLLTTYFYHIIIIQ